MDGPGDVMPWMSGSGPKSTLLPKSYFFMGLPVHFSPLVPDGHMILMGQNDGVMFSIPPKPRRHWWQRQRTVDARYTKTVIKTQRNFKDLFEAVPVVTQFPWEGKM